MKIVLQKKASNGGGMQPGVETTRESSSGSLAEPSCEWSGRHTVGLEFTNFHDQIQLYGHKVKYPVKSTTKELYGSRNSVKNLGWLQEKQNSIRSYFLL